jgi:hypothetical protein
MARRRLVGAVAVLALLAAAACAPADEGTGVAIGIVVDVDGDLSTVQAFTVSTEDGERMTFVPADDGDFAFPLPHLQEHVRSGAPVAVAWEREGETLWAIAVDDAGDSPH